MKKKKMIIEDPIAFLQEKWPGKQTKDIKEAFKLLKKVVTYKEKLKAGPKKEKIPNKEPIEVVIPIANEPFNLLNNLRQTCSSLDLLFLGRQISYHIAASSELSSVYADPEEVQSVISELLRQVVKRTPHGSRIDISLKEIPMRNGRGVEVAISGVDKNFQEGDLTGFLHELFGQELQNQSNSFFSCREVIIKQGGIFTVDLPKPGKPVYRVVLPTVGTPNLVGETQQTFKYEIQIKNIANIRKRFGIKKSKVFVNQIENYVRSLVRHPIDIVMAAFDKGLITAIYDTHEGMAQPVASRIAQRLGNEQFKIGKKIVEVYFKYNLTALPHSKYVLKKGK